VEEKENIKKSIFRQKVYAKRYYVKYHYNNFSGMYDVYYKDIEDIAEDETEELIEEKTIFSCDLSLPLLQCGDKFYIDELDLMVTIQDCYRTSKDEMVYYVEDKYISDEKTQETYNKAMDLVANCEKMKVFIEEIKSNKIYQKRIRHKMKSELR